MRTHGELRWRPNPASEVAFRDGDAGAWWAIRTAPYITIKVKRLFPRCDPYRDGWVVLRDTPEVCRDLEWLLDRYPLEMDDRDRARLTEGAQEHRDTERDVHEILSGQRRLPDDGWLDVDAGRERREYQYVAADLAIRTGRLLLVDELDWAPAMHDQVVGRLHRDGMRDPVVAYFLVSEGGSDPLMAEVLDLKRGQSDPILDPDAPILRPVDATGDRVRQLAEQVLERRRRRARG